MKSWKVLMAAGLLASAAQASVITYASTLSGANENPVVVSPATGFASFTVDTVLNTVNVNVTFSGLSTPDSGAFLHCCVVSPGNGGVASAVPFLAGFPAGVTSGTFTNMSFDLTSASFYNPAFVAANGATPTAAEAVLLAGMAANQSYFSINTTTNPGGEIRGFLVAVPEPSTFFLVGVAVAGLALGRRRLGSRI